MADTEGIKDVKNFVALLAPYRGDSPIATRKKFSTGSFIVPAYSWSLSPVAVRLLSKQTPKPLHFLTSAFLWKTTETTLTTIVSYISLF